MTDPSQYFKGRTVQEQMNEVIGYVDVRAEEVAAAKADDVLEPAEQAKTDAIAAKEAAEDAQAAAEQAVTDAAAVLANAVKKTGEASQSIAGDIAVSGTLSGSVVTGTQVTVPTPVNNTDATPKKYVDDVDALKANKTYVDAQDALKINITDINNYAVGLTGNQRASGSKTWVGNTSFTIEGDAWRASLTFPSAKKSDTTTDYSGWFRFMAGDPSDPGEIGRLEYDMMANGHRRLRVFLVSPGGTYVAKTLLEIDENGGIVS